MAIFNLQDQYSYYGVHHSNIINKIIHILFIPVCIFSGFLCVHHFQDYLSPIKEYISISTIFAILLCLYCCYLDLKVGILTSAWILLTNYMANNKVEQLGVEKATSDGVKLLAIAFVILLLGHFIFESVIQTFDLPTELESMFVAPLFITMELIFMFGYLNKQRLVFKIRIDGYFTEASTKRKLKSLK